MEQADFRFGRFQRAVAKVEAIWRKEGYPPTRSPGQTVLESLEIAKQGSLALRLAAEAAQQAHRQLRVALRALGSSGVEEWFARRRELDTPLQGADWQQALRDAMRGGL